jgi:hypothetical protein
MESTNENDLAGGRDDRPTVKFRDLTTVGEDAAARYLVGRDMDSGERVGIIVARPLADASPAVALAHADARIAAAQQAGTSMVDGMAPVRAVGRTAGGHPFAVSAIGDRTLLAEDLKGDDVVDPDTTLELLLRAARVLAAAHAAGLVHGSVGPYVIGTGPDGAVSLHGFGIAMPQMSLGSHADLGAREDVRALARVGRTMLTDRRLSAGREATVIPAALAALIARAESADPSITANEFALGLEDAAGERGQWHDSAADDGSVIPAASAHDSSRWSRSGRPITRLVVAVAAVLALLLIFGDQVLRSSGNENESAIAPPVAYPDGGEAGVPSFDSASSGVAGDRPTIEPDARSASANAGGVAERTATAPRASGRQAAGTPPANASLPPGNTGTIARESAGEVTGQPQAGHRSGVALASIPAGTTVRLSSGERVCTNTHFIGDRFTAAVAEPVRGAGGVLIPAGSRASVQITSVNHGEGDGELASVGLAVRHIVLSGVDYPVDATITSAQVEQVRTSSTSADAGKVVGGAVAGAILGQVLGKDTRSTVIGAATGAVAGTAIAMGTRDHAGCIPVGGTIAIRLNTPAGVAAQQ